MCVHSWVCRAPELVWFWCWKVFYLVKTPFGDNYYIFWHTILTFLFKNTKLSRERGKKSWPLFSNIVGWSETGKQTSFFFRPSLGKSSIHLICSLFIFLKWCLNSGQWYTEGHKSNLLPTTQIPSYGSQHSKQGHQCKCVVKKCISKRGQL